MNCDFFFTQNQDRDFRSFLTNIIFLIYCYFPLHIVMIWNEQYIDLNDSSGNIAILLANI